MPNICATCTNTTDEPYTLCEQCEIRTALSLLHVYVMIQPLQYLVDSSIRMGDNITHATSDIAPTPVRLPVLDLLDYADSTIRGLYARLHPPTHALERRLAQTGDIMLLLLTIVADDRLTQLPDIGIHVAAISQLEQHMSITLHDHDNTSLIGHCLNQLCGVAVYAADGEQTLTCDTCGMVQQVSDVRLAFWKQCVSSSKLVTAVQAATLLTTCGIRITASAVRQWAHRGKLHQVEGLYRLCDVATVAQSKSVCLTKV